MPTSTSRSRKSSKSRQTDVEPSDNEDESSVLKGSASARARKNASQRFLIFGCTAGILAAAFLASCITLLIVYNAGVCPKDTDNESDLIVVSQVNVTFIQFVKRVYTQYVNQVSVTLGLTQIGNMGTTGPIPTKPKEVENDTSQLIDNPVVKAEPKMNLPIGVYPTFYDIELRLGNFYSDRSAVYGNVVITLQVNENATDTITFNALRLQNMTARIQNDNISIVEGPYAIDEELGVYAVKLDTKLVQGVEYKLNFSYKAVINNGTKGFYSSSYKSPNAFLETFTASTQFEPYYARTLFPCFDEPRFRAQFRLTVYHLKSLHAFSNMPSVSVTTIEHSNGVRPDSRTEFEPTPPLPTYLVALFVGDYHESEGRTSINGTHIHIHGRHEFLKDTGMALNYAEASLNALQKLFPTIGYALTCLDITGIVKFNGAVETFGNVFASEQTVFLNDKYAGKADYDASLLTIAHEYSHQWFGDIVTPIDWSQAFMSEGLATFMSYYITHELKNDTMDLNSKYAIKTQQAAMEFDSLPTHPVEASADNLIELGLFFDAITYNKACSIFNMVRGLVGDKVFIQALRKYLEENQFGHAHWTKLASAIQKTVIDPDVKQINFTAFLEAWLTKPRYPVVKVSRNGTQYTIKTVPFRLTDDKNIDPRWPLDTTGWPVPIWYRRSGDLSTLEVLLVPNNIAVTFPVESEDELIFVNTENYGFYRVHYETPSLLKATIQAIQNDTTGILKGAHLRSYLDIFPLLYGGYVTPANFLKTLDLFKNDTVPAHHEVLSSEISKMLKRIGDTSGYDDLKKHLKGFLANIVKNGDVATSQTVKDVHQTLQKHECSAGNIDCKETTVQMFIDGVYKVCGPGEQTAKCTTIPVDDRERVYCEGAKSDNRNYYTRIMQYYQRNRNPFERIRLLKGAACVRDIDKVTTLFNTVTTPNAFIYDTHRVAVFNVLFENNHRFVKKMFINNAAKIERAFPDLFPGFITTVLTARDYVDDVPEFRKAFPNLAKKYEYLLRQLQNVNEFEIRFKKDILPYLMPKKDSFVGASVGNSAKKPSEQVFSEKHPVCASLGIC